MVVVTAGVLVVVTAGVLVVVTAGVLVVVGRFSDAAESQPPIAAATTATATALSPLLRARRHKESNQVTRQRLEPPLSGARAGRPSFLPFPTDGAPLGCAARNPTRCAARCAPRIPRRARTSRTGQTRTVPGDGEAHDPGPMGLAVIVADAVPAPGDMGPTRDRDTPTPDRAGAGCPAKPRDWIRPCIRILGVYAVVRIALLVADVLAARLNYGSNLSGPLRSWDSNWYLVVAAHGYPPVAATSGGQLTYSAAGFLPVFPALIRLFSFFGLSAAGAALVVSILGGAVATLLVLRLGTALVNQAAGWNAAVLFALFPGMGISWGLFYCECIGLGLTAGSLLLMLRERWLWAGVVGAFATATSPLALPLVLGAAVLAVQAVRNREPPRALCTMFLVPTGFVAYLIFVATRYHDLMFYWHLQSQAWGVSIDFGRSLLGLLPHPWMIGYQGPGWLEWIGLAAVAAGVFALWRARLPACVNAYCFGVVLLLFSSNNLGFKPRLLTWAFPVLIAVAKIARPRTRTAVVIVFACLLPVVFLTYTTLGNTMAQP